MKEDVKLFAAILYKENNELLKALNILSSNWGEIDFQSAPQEFNVTDYYKNEMGENLFRVLVSFKKIDDASNLSERKIYSILVENQLRNSFAGRTVNIDTGYIDFDKIVLASTKRGIYKIYMKDGIWADMVLHYEKGGYNPFIWSFADFKDGRYIKDCLHIRELFKKNIKMLNKSLSTP